MKWKQSIHFAQRQSCTKPFISGKCHTSVTSPSETKGFQCFWFNKSPEDALERSFFRIRNISKRKQTSGKKHSEHCLTDLNKTSCEISSVFDKVHFWVKNLTLFFHRTLQFHCTFLKRRKSIVTWKFFFRVILLLKQLTKTHYVLQCENELKISIMRSMYIILTLVS